MVKIFKLFWEQYYIEIIVSVLGVLITLASAIMNQDFNNDQIIIMLITVGVDTICLSNKSLSSDNHENVKRELNSLKVLNELYQFFADIPDEWKKLANEKINDLRNELKRMADGLLILSGDSLVKYQAKILQNAKHHVYAIHQAMDEKSLKRWDKRQTTKDFTVVLIKANERIRPFVEKRRIFIVDEDLLKKEEMKKLWRKIVREQRFKMHFKIKVITKQNCEKNSRIIPNDMLICDDEVVTVHFYDGKAQGELYRQREEIEREQEYFEDCWEWGQKNITISNDIDK